MERPYLLLLLLLLTACSKDPKLPQDPGLVTADFSWTGAQFAPARITFNNTSLNGLAFKWDFGNTQTSRSAHPDAVTYTTPGIYTVILRASNGFNDDMKSRDLIISADEQPEAHFSYSFRNNISYAPAVVNLINESVNADSYEWKINGAANTQKDPLPVSFTQAGNYVVELVAIKGAVRSSAMTATITVSADQNPVARFQLAHHPFPYVAGEDIQLVNLSTNSDSYEWSFGTPALPNSNETNPVVRFAAAGQYDITLRAKKGNSPVSTKTIRIEIRP